MSYGSEKLKELGVQRIHNDTHIAIQHINIVLNEEFENINKVQFLGFLSILEREYDIDLSDIKANGLEYYKSDANTYNGEPGVFVIAGRHKTFRIFYIILALMVFAIAIFFTMNYETKSNVIVENEVINEVKKNIEAVQESVEESVSLVSKDDEVTINNEETNEVDSSPTQSQEIKVEVVESTQKVSQEDVETQNEISENKQESVTLSPLVIIPRSKLWIGYIDIETNQKYQKIITEPIVLDAYKKWLLFLGHGNVNIEVDGIANEYRDKKSLRFAYKNGKIKRITTEEFQKLNRGSRW